MDDRGLPRPDDALVLWVYGVTAGNVAALPPCPGVDAAHDVRLIRHAGLAAIVSEVPLAEYHEAALREQLEDLAWLERVARAHERVLDAALAVGAVVPFRICTIYQSAERVREMLAAARPALDETLRRLRGASEWGVKAYVLRGAARRPSAEPPGSGIAYLAHKRDARVAEETAQQAVEAALQQIHAELQARAVGAVLSRPQDRRLSRHDGDMVLNAAYLVADDVLDDFRAAFHELVARHAGDGFTLELTGPWPAYHFARAPAPAA